MGDSVVQMFVHFISNTLTHSNWVYRQGAILAFAVLLEGISEDLIKQLISSSLSGYIHTLVDPHSKVKVNVTNVWTNNDVLFVDLIIQDKWS